MLILFVLIVQLFSPERGQNWQYYTTLRLSLEKSAKIKRFGLNRVANLAGGLPLSGLEGDTEKRRDLL
jgi:hypothetical protein